MNFETDLRLHLLIFAFESEVHLVKHFMFFYLLDTKDIKKKREILL